MKYTLARVLLCGLSAALLAGITNPEASAATIVAAKTENLLHNDTNSPWFTSASGGGSLAASGGWAPIVPTQAGAASSTSVTTKKSFSIVGDSTAAGNWTDGNGVPAGITLAFDAQFTVSALPTGSILTNPGASGSNVGQGIGITQTVGGNDDIDVGDGIGVSSVLVSGVTFSGSLANPGYAFTPGGVSGFGTILIRSNNFTEASAGMVLTQGADTIGFGTATGTVASGLAANNNFGPPGSPASSIFPRQAGPYTLIVTQGASVIKGMTLAYDVTYDIKPVPEPASGMLLIVSAVAVRGAGRLSRRKL